MPLSALIANETVYAFNFSSKAWQDLRTKADEIRFPCCDARVVLKRSPLGTQFFAHTKKGKCATAPETAEHLQAKDIIARTAIEAGWSAETEVGGPDWIADVMVSRGSVKLAFEVQWSRQSLEDTEARQKRYAASGVRALWLMRQKDIPPPSKALPAFCLDKTDNGFRVVVDQNPISRFTRQHCSLDEFVRSALGRRLIWRPKTGKTIQLSWRARKRRCENCNDWNKVPIIGNLGDALTIEPKQLLGKPDFLINALIPVAIRKHHQIAALDFSGEIVYQSCRCCGASLMDQRYLHGKVIVIPAFDVVLSTSIIDSINESHAFDYWRIADR
jgi:hypothetical protein